MVIHVRFIVLSLLFLTFVNTQIIIKDAGIARIKPEQIAMIFYLTMENVCPKEVDVSVRSVNCCLINPFTGKHDCDSMRLLGGDPGTLCPGKSRNATLLYPNLYLYDLQGYCTVVVVYTLDNKAEHFFSTIDFNTKNKFIDTDLVRSTCYSADLDSYRNCTPVDCPVKYSGTKNFFNPTNRYCEPVPYCRSLPGKQEMYNVIKNKCDDLSKTVSRDDLILIEERRTSFGPMPYIFGNVKCHQGCMDTNTGECICNPGWITSLSNDPEFAPSLITVHMCNVQTGSWTELNKDKIALTILALIVLTSLCVLKVFFIICLLHFCYKWAKNRSIERSRPVNRRMYKPCVESSACNRCFCKEHRFPKADVCVNAVQTTVHCLCENKAVQIHRSKLLIGRDTSKVGQTATPAQHEERAASPVVERTISHVCYKERAVSAVDLSKKVKEKTCWCQTSSSTTIQPCVRFSSNDESESSSEESSSEDIELSYTDSAGGVSLVSYNTCGYKRMSKATGMQSTKTALYEDDLELECTSSDADSTPDAK